ncbi:MAG: glutamate--tRNA ligase, partial [Eggerthellaceae bacterium]|nr:glutamate--tRNA ligase [Eggerthellaceae bacterium]
LDGETTIIPRDVLCREFSQSRITKKDAVFDEKKLDWMNGQYIKAMGASDWVVASAPWLASAHAAGNSVRETEIVPSLPADETPAHYEVSADEASAFQSDLDARPWFYAALYPLVAERETVLAEAEPKLQYMFWGPNVVLDEKSVNKVLRKEGARAEDALRACREVLADEGIAWECDPLQEKCRALTEVLDMKAKLLFQPLRVAICGNMVSPPLFESIELLPREDVLARIDATLKKAF